ncbi:DUF5947 family protein [Paludisphaera mucosa]|uniref:DUF5947 family protein n=1 Tax=Paludisphaera mucosa TaxID=3030827 RepID=A0ABT6FCY5_9BACT|nr:DUF5947 family protein [Paludisphaera mucosa]MDG3005446.1 DUF5947 family protein [Paludisphaera mucosa]
MTTASSTSRTAFAALRRFAEVRPAGERCDLCAKPVAPGHRHLMEAVTRRFVCACDPCALLFAEQPTARYRALPRTPLRLDHFRMTEAQWTALGIPINMVFFTKDGHDGRVIAQFPGPAGATEAFLDPEAWNPLVEANPILHRLRHDVEAILVNRVGASRDYYLVPIDFGFGLAGLIRLHWRGLEGGAEVWAEIGRFFDRLRSMSAGATHA